MSVGGNGGNGGDGYGYDGADTVDASGARGHHQRFLVSAGRQIPDIAYGEGADEGHPYAVGGEGRQRGESHGHAARRGHDVVSADERSHRR